MNRRELLRMVSLATGAVVIGGEFFMTGCKNNASIGGATFTKDDIAFLDEVADTIIPATKSPGAKAAKVGTFMTVMVNDCYNEADQKVFHAGIAKLNEASNKKFSSGFMEITPAQRLELLKEIDANAAAFNKKAEAIFDAYTPAQKTQMALDENKDGKDPKADKMRENPDHYYVQMKQLTILGYFTSKEGATEALRYLPVPGKYDGSFPYKKGDKAWAT
ncbi:MAG: gluconate 2-dehydrogenase subunit 3 family protein [Chitinophagaceae bacterium]|nr:gluconate 2-dehydrogenase subunit 3 family protein [Chitinophagaceae bacterium]